MGFQPHPLHQAAPLWSLEAVALPDHHAPCGASPGGMKRCQIRVWNLEGYWGCQICVRNLQGERAANSASNLDRRRVASTVSDCGAIQPGWQICTKGSRLLLGCQVYATLGEIWALRWATHFELRELLVLDWFNAAVCIEVCTTILPTWRRLIL